LIKLPEVSASKWIRGVLGLSATVIALSGCGSSPDPLGQAGDAARKTLALPGVSYSMTLDGTNLFGPSVKPLGGRAAYDLSAGVGYEALTLRGDDGSTRVLYLDFKPDAFYLTPDPAPAGVLPDGKVWISSRFAGPSATPATRRLAAQAEGLSPELALAEIAWGAESASRIGTRVIRHVPAEEYRVSVNLEKALLAATRAGRPALAAAIESQLRAARSGRASVDIWVNGPGYVARIEHTVPGSGLGKASFSFSDYASQFTRTSPLPAQTVPLASIAGARSLWAIATAT
jgi:hypothetical protein